MIPVGYLMEKSFSSYLPKEVEYMTCQGQTLSILEYPELYEALGTMWGPSTPDRFQLPDCSSLIIITRSPYHEPQQLSLFSGKEHAQTSR